MKTTYLPIPVPLLQDVDSIRLIEHNSLTTMNLNVCVNGLPGIVFEHRNGDSPLESIRTPNGSVAHIPTLYLYGQVTQAGVMRYQAGSYASLQVVLKPHALQTLFGLNASMMTNSIVDLSEFTDSGFQMRMLEAGNVSEQVRLITRFLVDKLEQARKRDCLIEESLCHIQRTGGAINVGTLLDQLGLSERQFEKRFNQTVGLSPHFYIRVKRFNRALRLMQTRPSDTLTTIAHHLDFHDQSHFIRDVKAFSGITPKNLVQKLADFEGDRSVYAYT